MNETISYGRSARNHRSQKLGLALFIHPNGKPNKRDTSAQTWYEPSEIKDAIKLANKLNADMKKLKSDVRFSLGFYNRRTTADDRELQWDDEVRPNWRDWQPRAKSFKKNIVTP
jgi:hypothetical protein